jgi:alpha-beta hydrolase superfamily lysophospholipase
VEAAGGGAWGPDILGAGFFSMTLPLEPDAQGPVAATLVHYAPAPARETVLDRVFRRRPEPGVAAGAAVLYLHGWSDYFFQKHHAEFWHRAGADFYALDLRKYGRSLRQGQTPGYITDLKTYDEDIEAAIAVIGADAVAADRPLILVGHSTGGLTLSLWAARNVGRFSALVLNSPWLEFQGNQAGRLAIAPVVGLGARYRPLERLPTVDLGFYTRTVSSRFDGEWDYSAEWRPDHGFAVHPAWLNAILEGHAAVALGLRIDAPVFTMLSTRSSLLPRWSPVMAESDTAIDVEIVAQRSLRLGPLVTVLRLEGALHDVFLSKRQVREQAFAQLERWLRGYAK